MEIEDDEEEEEWGQWSWDSEWWSQEDDDCRDGKKATPSPRRRRSAASSGSSSRAEPKSWPAEGPEEMAMWRGLLHIPGKNASGMQAVPNAVADNIQQYAMSTSESDALALYASFARFISLLVAEINAALVAARKKQSANRKHWTLPGPGDKGGGGGDASGSGDADAASMMQVTGPTPGFSALSALRRELMEVNPRMRATRAWVLLKRLRESAYYKLGRELTGPVVPSLEELLLAQSPIEGLHYEDSEVMWCENMWTSMRRALEAVMMASAPGTRRPQDRREGLIGQWMWSRRLHNLPEHLQVAVEVQCPP